MLNDKRIIMIMMVIFAGIFLTPTTVLADDHDQIIEVEVKGMFCPICAYGAEKKVKEIEGVESVVADLKAGKITIVTKSRESHTHKITEEELKEAIKKAGFEPGKIEYIHEEEDGGQVPE